MNTERVGAAECKMRVRGLVALAIGLLLYPGESFARSAKRGGTDLSAKAWHLPDGASATQIAQRGGTEAKTAAKRPGASSAQEVAFNPHDPSGIWQLQGGEILSRQVPPMTPWAQARYDAAKPGIGPRAQPQGNDPIIMCNPPGFPRILLFGAYPLEIIQLPDRVLQFFDFFYAYRTIWTDGQKLPKDPVPRWYGYSVGEWDGNTFVVNSSGFDDRSWLDEDGHPHSSEMRIQERYERIGPNTIRLSMTLIDPKAYTKPWVSDVKFLKRDTQDKMQEDLCAPADEEKYKEEIREPAATPPGQQP